MNYRTALEGALALASIIKSAPFLAVEAEVRYWEDAEINGETCDEAGAAMPLRNGQNWCPVIRMADGVILDWPQGTTADIHFKVCDAGAYYLLDDERRRMARLANDYVPDCLSPTEEAFGDYIILKIDADGQIENWHRPEFSVSQVVLLDPEAGKDIAMAALGGPT